MKQAPDNIRELLDRYWDGDTTVEEERLLKSFFANDDIPEAYQQEARWFRILQTEQSVAMPGTQRNWAPVEQKPAVRQVSMPEHRVRWGSMAAAVLLLLTAGIWWWTTHEEPVPVRIIANQAPERYQQQSASASLPEPAVAATDKTMSQHGAAKPARKSKPRTTQPQVETKIQPALAGDTCDDPEEALVEIKAALALVSSKINKSKRTLDKGLQEMEHVDMLIKRSL